MDSLASIQGLATGIDFRDLVDRIIQAESRPVLVMENRQVELGRQRTAWSEFERRMRALDGLASELGGGAVFDARTASVRGEDAGFSATAAAGASLGSFAVEVLRMPARETVGSDVFGSRTEALGLSGELLLGGRAVSVSPEDALQDVAASLNAVNTGLARSGVTASIVGSDQAGYRIVLTADEPGAAGIRMADGANGLLRALGFLDGTTSLRHPTSDGATSDGFTSATTAIGSLLGMTAPPPPASVGIGALSVALDLATAGLEDIADAINAAAAAAGSSIEAAVVRETAADGRVTHRLDIDGTTSFTDEGGILETLGVLEGNRGAVAQRLRGPAFTDGDAGTPATAASRLVDLWRDGEAAGAQAGDTLSLSGTRADGTTFATTFTIGADSTMQDLLDALNAPGTGFAAAERGATASLEEGTLVVTDDEGGSSRLALSVVSNNEGGGALDFGEIGVERVGRQRRITAGQDAELVVDGTFYTRSSRIVDDIVPGVTLTLSGVSAGAAVLDVERDTEAAAARIEAFVSAYNGVSEFVTSQFTGAGATEGGTRPPLSGESILRSMRTRLRSAFDAALGSTSSASGTLSEIGITANRRGTYDVDAGKLRAAIEADPLGVERLFSEHGATSSPALRYVSAGVEGVPGTYDVVVTTPAARARAVGTGFAGTYVDDGIPDTITVTDTGSGAAWSVLLSNGMSLQDVVDALNAELATPTRRELRAARTFTTDEGTPAGPATALGTLRDANGQAVGVADGDTFTVAGSRPDGTSFFHTWTVTDASTQTLEDLRARISAAVGPDVSVEIVGGALTAVAVEEGRSAFTLTVSSDNAGGGAFDLGGLDVAVEGRPAARITASGEGGELVLTHEDHGAASGFEISYAAGGVDGTASLGLAPGTWAGTDVAGTIGGRPATGVGRVLTGSEGSEVAGLSVLYTGTTTGVVGSVSWARGLGAEIARVTDGLLGGEAGSIQALVEGIDTRSRKLDDRIEAFEARLDMRAENLIRRFTALEEAMAKAQQQMSWLQAQLGSLLAMP